jgi:ABC-type Fe3+ transport system permease subunit
MVLAQIHAPLAMLLIGRGLGRLHLTGLEAARLHLRGRQLVGWMAGAVRREIVAAFLLGLALSLGNFAVPHVMQCRLYPIEIYMRLANYHDQAGALSASLPLVGLVLLAAGLMAVAWRRSDRVLPSVAMPSAWPLGRWTWLAGLSLFVYFGLVILLPLAALVYECRSPGDFLAEVRAAAPETENTLWIAAAAALAACVAGLIVGTWSARRRHRLADLAAIVPIGLPAMVVGLAYSRFYHHDWPIDLAVLGDTSALVTLGLTVRAWPFATQIFDAGQRRIAPEWRDAARLGGLAGLRRWRWIDGPLLARHAAAAALVGFVLAVGEVEISQMLCAPGEGTLALRLFTSLHLSPLHQTASLALLQWLVAIVPVLAYSLLVDAGRQNVSAR